MLRSQRCVIQELFTLIGIGSERLRHGLKSMEILLEACRAGRGWAKEMVLTKYLLCSRHITSRRSPRHVIQTPLFINGEGTIIWYLLNDGWRKTFSEMNHSFIHIIKICAHILHKTVIRDSKGSGALRCDKVTWLHQVSFEATGQIGAGACWMQSLGPWWARSPRGQGGAPFPNLAACSGLEG
jgi:hypothetical protein